MNWSNYWLDTKRIFDELLDVGQWWSWDQQVWMPSNKNLAWRAYGPTQDMQWGQGLQLIEDFDAANNGGHLVLGAVF